MAPDPHLSRRQFAAVALVIWLIVGSPELRDALRPALSSPLPPPATWAVAFILFGVGILLWARGTRSPRTAWALIAAEVMAIVVMSTAEGSAAFAILFVITSWQAATLLPSRRAVAWATAQSLGFLLLWRGWMCPEYCLMIALGYGLSLFAVFAAHALRREAEAARRLAEAHARLQAAQALLAENARSAERTRIARELHDTWGHELTALALQLEVASHVVPDGPGRARIERAKGMSRALLDRVRDVVGALRDVDARELRQSLERLADDIPNPVIHLALPENLEPETAAHAHVLLRCAQEAVTNTVRHAGAANLWLEIKKTNEGVRLLARDDGRGADPGGRAGNGLTGMRERLEALGGGMAITSRANKGFAIDAWVPTLASKAT